MPGYFHALDPGCLPEPDLLAQRIRYLDRARNRDVVVKRLRLDRTAGGPHGPPPSTHYNIMEKIVLSNQSKILANQLAIKSNQASILKNQKKLDQVLGNQSELLGNQKTIKANQSKILANQTKILANQTKILAK
jgi:hypothetical protein